MDNIVVQYLVVQYISGRENAMIILLYCMNCNNLLYIYIYILQFTTAFIYFGKEDNAV